MVKNIAQELADYACGDRPSLANKTGDWRFLTPAAAGRLSPCRQACLLDSEIPVWLEAVKRESWDEAWQITRKKNPFPGITGHVCFHPCAENCNRLQLDEGIDIRGVERAVGRWRMENYRPPKGPRVIRGRVAVVGSGPAGLSCAWYLNHAGFRVAVFEREAVAGGLLALGIPAYRLPREVLQRELQMLEEDGVSFEFNCGLGQSFNLDELAAEYDAVFLATGALKTRPPALEGIESEGVWSAIDFLKRFNLGSPPAVSGPVVVIGGGNAAVDAARTAASIVGAAGVRIVYRRSREEMPASPEEIGHAEAEGIGFMFNVLPAVARTAGGRITGLVLERSESAEPGGAVIVKKGETLEIGCCSLIYATGQEPDHSVFGKTVTGYRLFAGGDLVSGPATVPEAISAGRIAAAAIAGRLAGAAVPGGTDKENTEKAVSFEELRLHALPSAQMTRREDDPSAEASRCLGCGSCISCGICDLFCPDLSVRHEEGRYTVNLDYCKGCGICAYECPSRALVMEGSAIHGC